jgi:hypothetical protein
LNSPHQQIDVLRQKLEACRIVLEQYTLSGPIVLQYGLTMKDVRERVSYYVRMIKHFQGIESPEKYLCLPVDADTFLMAPELGNHSESVYPEVRRCFAELNSGQYVEGVFTGGIGSGKTQISLWTQEFQLYLLSCLKNPHREFNLDPSSEIMFVFQNLSGKLAKVVDFDRFKASVEQIAYFKLHFPFDPNLTSELRFPRRIIIKPLTGDVGAAIGQNIFGGIIDEVDFMAIVEKSKQSTDGGEFDQAKEMYDSIVRRRKSRFLINGKMLGMLCLVSSKRYPGAFTDRKELEAKTDNTIYVYNKRVWEIKPPGTYSGEWFYVYIGTDSQKPRILQDGEDVSGLNPDLIRPIPVELRTEFNRDLLSALRDIAGVATLALHPFILDRDALGRAFGRCISILSSETCDFTTSQLKIFPRRFIRQQEPRWIHLDIGITKDSLGMSCAWVPGFVNIPRTEDESEQLPQIQFDFVLEVPPPPHGEISLERVRSVIYKLREQGLNIRWVSMDSSNCRDMMQILRSRGLTSGYISVDATSLPYDLCKTAMYDGRLSAPMHDKALSEFGRLEVDVKSGKIDHPADGSKDSSDSMAGCVYGLTMRREIWHRYGIPPNAIPRSLIAKIQSGPSQGVAI